MTKQEEITKLKSEIELLQEKLESVENQTIISQEKFLSEYGDICPYCGEIDEADDAHINYARVRDFRLAHEKDAQCGKCGKKWVVVYKMTHYVPINV